MYESVYIAEKSEKLGRVYESVPFANSEGFGRVSESAYIAEKSEMLGRVYEE